MKNSIYLIVLSLLFVISKTHAQEIKALTLEDAIYTGIANSHFLKAANIDLRISQTLNTKAAAGYYPTLQFNASHTHSIQNTQLDFFDGREIAQKGAYSNNTNAGLTFLYTIFDGARRKNIKEQLALLEATSRTAFLEQLDQLVYQITISYIQVLRQQLLAEQMKLQLNQSLQRLELAQSLEERGVGSKLSTLQSKVNLQQDSLNYQTGLADLEISKRRLLHSMNVEDHFPFTASRDKIMSIAAPNISELISTMEKSAPTASRLQYVIQSAEKRKKEFNALNYPELNLISTLNYNLSNNQANFVIQSSNIGPAVGINLQYPIFDNGFKKRQVQVATLEIQRAKEMLDDWRIQTTNQIKLALLESQQQAELAERQNKAIVLFEENMQLSEETFKRGRLTDIELREAQLSYYRAVITEIIHRLNSKQALFDAYFLSGKGREILGVN
jgi:outer membrane protein TolC